MPCLFCERAPWPPFVFSPNLGLCSARISRTSLMAHLCRVMIELSGRNRLHTHSHNRTHAIYTPDNTRMKRPVSFVPLTPLSFTALINGCFCCFAFLFEGVEGEFQLWTVLPAVQREGRQVSRRGASSVGLSVQRARRLLGGTRLIFSRSTENLAMVRAVGTDFLLDSFESLSAI